MSCIHYPRVKTPSSRPHYPWLVFLFLAVAFFLGSHDPSGAQRTLDDYNRSQDDIVQGVSGGSTVREIALLTLGAAAGLSLISYSAPRRLQSTGVAAYVLCAFAAWTVVSVLWADDATMSIKRLVASAILSLAAVAIVRMFSLREIIIWVFFTTAAFLIIAIALEIFAGAFQPWASGYRFAGTQHPNGEGIECGLLVLSGLAASQLDKERLWIYRSFAGAGMMFLLLTESRTSLTATALAVAVYLAMSGWTASKKVILVSSIIATGLVVATLATGLSPVLTNALSKQRDGDASVESFAGRTQIWRDVTDYILRRPLTGHGYGSFWTPEHINAISDEEKWGVPDSHSVYVDYLLTVGAVGLTLYLVCLIQGLWRSLSLSYGTGNKGIPFLTGILIFGAIDGFFESSIGEGSLLMFLCIIVLVWLAFTPVPQPRAAITNLFYEREAMAQR
jgi:O-antigen ligase